MFFGRVLICLMVAAGGPQALASLDCSQRGELDREIRLQRYQANFYQAHFEHLSEISQDASTMKNVSSGLAITSGVLFMAGTGLGWAWLGADVPEAIGAFGLASGTNFWVRFVPGLLGGATGGSLAPAGANEVVWSVIGAAVVSTPDAWYSIGTGLYNFTVSGHTYQINEAEIRDSEGKIREAVASLSSAISEKVNTPPSEMKNALSFGGRNARHFSELAGMAEIRARLQFDLVKVLEVEKKAQAAACAFY